MAHLVSPAPVNSSNGVRRRDVAKVNSSIGVRQARDVARVNSSIGVGVRCGVARSDARRPVGSSASCRRHSVECLGA